MDEQITSGVNVSRETYDKLRAFEALLGKWNQRINLVSKSTAAAIWERHIQDSAQIWSYAPANVTTWLDLGSGGGLPAIVVAVIGQAEGRLGRMTMVESDQRKSVFLREAVRTLGLNATVMDQRIEQLDPIPSDVISARALADLPKLLEFAHPHLKDGTRLLLPKGVRFRQELNEAQNRWSFAVKVHPSVTEPDAAILQLDDLTPNLQDMT